MWWKNDVEISVIMRRLVPAFSGAGHTLCSREVMV